MKANFSKKMLREVNDICDHILQVGDIVNDPPCNIAECVRFIDGVCPFSKEKDCSFCIANEFDAECMSYLISSTKFGRA